MKQIARLAAPVLLTIVSVLSFGMSWGEEGFQYPSEQQHCRHESGFHSESGSPDQEIEVCQIDDSNTPFPTGGSPQNPTSPVGVGSAYALATCELLPGDVVTLPSDPTLAAYLLGCAASAMTPLP